MKISYDPEIDALYMVIELQAGKLGLKRVPRHELPRIRDVLR